MEEDIYVKAQDCVSTVVVPVLTLNPMIREMRALVMHVAETEPVIVAMVLE